MPKSEVSPLTAPVSAVRIAYLTLDADLMADVEQALIVCFNRPLNNLGAQCKPDVPVGNGLGLQVKRVREIVCDFPGLGQRIRQARGQDGRSLTEICRTSGISRSYWYQLEGEDLRSPAKEEVIRKIEQALGVDARSAV